MKDFIVDFFCYDAMLSIEVDGEVHNDSYQKERDEQRKMILKKLGINELRYTNEQVLNQIDEVIQEIESELSK